MRQILPTAWTRARGFGRGFAVGGGVAAAVVEAIKHIDPDREIQIEYGDGLRECRKMLMHGQGRKAQRLSAGGHGLPRRLRGRRRHPRVPSRNPPPSVERFKNAASSMSTTESPYLGRLKDVEETC